MNTVRAILTDFFNAFAFLLIIVTINVFWIWFGNKFDLNYPAGVMAASMCNLYIAWVVLSWREQRAMDEAFTGMMNMVPKEQRFGYDEDFPANQRWHH